MSLFCYQCQETALGKDCTIKGGWGKTSEVANLQDLLLFTLKGISHYTVTTRSQKKEVAIIGKTKCVCLCKTKCV